MTNVESAVIYLRNSEMESAREAIDAAALNDVTKDDPKMWFVRTTVYDTMYRNPEYKKIDANMEEKFVVSSLKCMSTDTKKRYEYYCATAVINGAFAAYNKAIEYYGANDTKNALKFFQYVTQVFPYDKNGDLKKNNITEKQINKYIADLYYINEDYTNALKYYDVLINADYNNPSIYIFASNCSFMLKDSAAGMATIDKGRSKFPSDMDLVKQELNVYLKQGKQQILLDKLNDALNLDNENAMLLFVRGNVYDQFASNAFKTFKLSRDTAAVMGQKAKGEKTPAGKTRLEAASRSFMSKADSLKIANKKFMDLAEKDYQAAVQINPDYLDAWYNLGALMNNRTTEIVDRMNALTSNNQDEYDRKWGVMKKVQDSILNGALGYFNKALELASNLPEDNNDKKKYKNSNLVSIYFSLQQVYANLGDEKKTMEYRKKRTDIESAQ